jgi:hypothetical protein
MGLYIYINCLLYLPSQKAVLAQYTCCLGTPPIRPDSISTVTVGLDSCADENCPFKGVTGLAACKGNHIAYDATTKKYEIIVVHHKASRR